MDIEKIRILKVKTKIINKIQRVLLKLEGKDIPVDIPFVGVSKLFPDADIRTIEFLVGSYFVVSNTESQNNSVKWSLEIQSEFSECLEMNKSLYRNFQKINHIIPAQIDSHSPAFLIEGFVYKFFVPMEMFLALTGLEFNDYKLIQGSYMTYDTWNEGEWAGDFDEFEDPIVQGYTRKVKKSGVLLKYPIFRTPNDLDTTSGKHKVVLMGGERRKQPFVYRRTKK